MDCDLRTTTSSEEISEKELKKRKWLTNVVNEMEGIDQEILDDLLENWIKGGE